MKILVNFYANLREIVGSKKVELELADPVTVKQIIGRIIQLYPALSAQMLAEDGHLAEHIHLFINGRDINYLPNGSETSLAEPDKVDVFPSVAGG